MTAREAKLEPDHPFDYFEGGVSPIEVFRMECDAALKAQHDCIIAEEEDETYYDSRPSIAFIALMAFAEAFFKSTFAAVGNMSRLALERFASKRRDLKLPLDDVLSLGSPVNWRLGSLIAENLDFGSASAINSLFYDLIDVSPFRSDEARTYSNLLSDRNQLVHHGGVITARYFRQHADRNHSAQDIYWNSLVIKPDDTVSASQFLSEIASKVTEAVYDRLVSFEGDKVLDSEEGEKYFVFRYFLGHARAILT